MDKMRICKYVNCRHNDKINIDLEPFQKDRYGYYHEDCYKEKCDLQLFRDLWKKNISNTVVITQLNSILNELLSCGVSSEYLLFVLQYVIRNHKQLRYPNGFRYYVDNQSIKDEYDKTNRTVIKQDQFVADTSKDNSPMFSIRKKEYGFQSVLKKDDAN